MVKITYVGTIFEDLGTGWDGIRSLNDSVFTTFQKKNMAMDQTELTPNSYMIGKISKV